MTITTGAGLQDPEWPEDPNIYKQAIRTTLASHYLGEGAEVVVIEPDLDAANELVGSRIGNSKRLDVIHGDPQDGDLPDSALLLMTRRLQHWLMIISTSQSRCEQKTRSA